ncbi:MAG: transcriptional regulator [Planctomycetes bacterium]|nr:transcriptional regulator [Planctomycetota bacterium]
MKKPEQLIDVFTQIDDPKVMQKFFTEIFTPAERHDLETRWQSMKLLSQNIPQRKIAEMLSISLCKITRGAKVLKQKNSVSKKILKTSN